MKIITENEKKNTILPLVRDIIESKCPIYILGRNQWADDIAENIEPVGYIDEFTDENLYHDKPIIHDLSQIPEDSIVISCILGRPQTVRDKLTQAGIKFVDYFSFWNFAGLNLIDARGWKKFRNNFNPSSYEMIYEILEDSISRSTLEDIVNFRLTLDLDFMNSYKENQRNQYFEDFLDLDKGKEEYFIDIGGYDGETTMMFLEKAGNPRGAFVIEPDLDNITKARHNIESKFPDMPVKFLEGAVGSKKDTVYLSGEGSTVKLVDDGLKKIELLRLDDLHDRFDASPTFIKMDVEGSELEVLKGAVGILKKFLPKLAVSVYHKPDDIIEIYNFIRELKLPYKVYLRHYTEGIDETVMFFIP